MSLREPASPGKAGFPEDYDALLASLQTLGHPVRVLTGTPLGKQLVAVTCGEERGPLALVVAGAHAEEVAGVLASLRLLADPPPGVRLVVVPCRDPLGYHGVRATLRDALGKPIAVASHEDLVAILRRRGRILYEEQGGVVGGELPGIEGVAWVSLPLDDPRMVEPVELVQEWLEATPAAAAALAARRLLLPGSPRFAEGRDPYGWAGAPTLYADPKAGIGNFNRFFDLPNPLPEIAALRRLVDELQPSLTLDLHEGWGSGVFAFASYGDDRRVLGEAVAQQVSAAWRGVGCRFFTEGELAAHLGDRATELRWVAPGIAGGRFEPDKAPPALGPYAAQYGVSVTTEPGMENPLAHRITWIEAAARAALGALAQGSGAGR